MKALFTAFDDAADLFVKFFPHRVNLDSIDLCWGEF
jgi:hypothetical protein